MTKTQEKVAEIKLYLASFTSCFLSQKIDPTKVGFFV